MKRIHLKLIALTAAGMNAAVLNAAVHIGADSIVRVASDTGLAEYAKVAFDLPVAADWKVLARTGEGLKAQSAWTPVGEGKTVPWYVLLNDGQKTALSHDARGGGRRHGDSGLQRGEPSVRGAVRGVARGA